MQIHKILALAGVSMLFAMPAQSADQPLPGQWQITLKMNMKGGPQIPPEQLAKMKQMGIASPLGGGEPRVITQCLTPEQAAAERPFEKAGGSKDCALTNYQRSGNKITGLMVCKGEHFSGEGPFEMTLDNPKAYHGSWSIKGVSKRGGPIEQGTELSGQWLQAACDK